MVQSMNNITVFTPTYNRAEKLQILYDSLCRQTRQGFIWLIVDDGSTDNTELAVNKWIHDGTLNIQYYKQDNRGKMRAHNYGAQLCNTKYFVCVDSDDYLVDDAIEIMETNIPLIDEDDNIIGIILQRKLSDSDGKSFSLTGNYTTLKNLYDSGFKGETTLLFKTEMLRLFPFPVVDGEKFITENISYSLIDQKYKYLFISKAVTICEYNPDGYTMNLLSLYKNNPCGYVNYFNQLADLYGKEEDRQRAYMFTFFIKNNNLRADYRKRDYSLKTKIYGFLRYLNVLHRSYRIK